MANQHGFVRGLDSVSESSVHEGLFGRMFRNLDAADHPKAALIALGETMISGEFSDRIEANSKPGAKIQKGDNAIGEKDSDENFRIPAGYTYLGQFIDHDITFDPTSSLDKQNDPDALHNFRTPRMDLDSMYGTGPDDQPFLYHKGGTHFVLGENISFDGKKRPDLQRNIATPARAITGDKRNDENKIVSQLHGLFLRFHNVVYDFLAAKPEAQGKSANEIFAKAQAMVRWHYQWIIIHDYLPRVCGSATVKAIMNTKDGTPDLKYFKPHSGLGYLPVEFSGAAFRFGHSMVRPSYHLNPDLEKKFTAHNIHIKFKDGDLDFNRIPIFVKPSAQSNETSLNAFGALPKGWAIDWRYFFDDLGGKRGLPQPSYKIDSLLVDPLAALPDHAGMPVNLQSLANLNLLRGKSLGLPSGQAVARRLGLEPLKDAELYKIDGLARGATDPRKALLTDCKNNFANNAPLWFYILREAELKSKSQHLGPVGGMIVAEVLIGLIALDRRSYVQMEPRWQPGPDALGGKRGTFGMSDLIKFTETHEHK